MKNVTVSLDDATYRNAKRRAAEEDRSLSAVVREALQSYGSQESEFDRLKRRQDELFDDLRRRGAGIDSVRDHRRDDGYDPDRRQAERAARGYG